MTCSSGFPGHAPSTAGIVLVKIMAEGGVEGDPWPNLEVDSSVGLHHLMLILKASLVHNNYWPTLTI